MWRPFRYPQSEEALCCGDRDTLIKEDSMSYKNSEEPNSSFIIVSKTPGRGTISHKIDHSPELLYINTAERM
jgi:hypothetical protein